MQKMWEIIKAIEDVGIKVNRAYWSDDENLEVDVDPSCEDQAADAVKAMWHNIQGERLDSLGLIEQEIEPTEQSQPQSDQ
jgi:hypothetical protein